MLNSRNVGLAAGLVTIGVANAAVTMTLEWQTSIDGVSWQSGPREIAPDTSLVHVRLLAGWQNAPEARFFARASIDAVIEGLAGAGSADGIVPGSAQRLGTLNFPNRYQTIIPRRFNQSIVLDSPEDAFAPGALQPGARWLSPFQNVSTVLVAGNPLDIVHFTLQLDGSPGRRDIYAVGGPPVPGEPYAFWADLHGPLGNYDIQVETVTQTSASIIVPAPGGAIVVMASALACARRRR